MKFASTSMLLHTALSHKVALVIVFEHKTRTFFLLITWQRPLFIVLVIFACWR
jgi:hypothetical protein